MIEKSKEYSGEYLFRNVRDQIHSTHPEINPYLALFGCSDEVTGSADAVRANVFGGYGGIFTTRMIGSQIFYQQIKIAISRGHRSNVFEVNVHVGEMLENGRKIYGTLIGRDGNKRATCGALAHVLEDFCRNPDEVPSVSQTVDGEPYLDFLATLKFRLKPHIPKILSAEDRVLEITKTNLDVQIRELIRQLQKTLANEPSLAPMFVYGTIAYNRTTQPDTESIEHFYVLEGDQPSQCIDFLSRYTTSRGLNGFNGIQSAMERRTSSSSRWR